MHAEFVVRAAEPWKHVICEKPMAVSVAECDKMIAACNRSEKMLSIGYRLNLDHYNSEFKIICQQQVLGKVPSIKAEDGMALKDGDWINL